MPNFNLVSTSDILPNISKQEGIIIHEVVILPEFGDRLRDLREARGLTQEQLGMLFSVKKGAISKYEKGRTTPDPTTISKLADYFDVTADFLLGRKGKAQIRLPILGTIRAGVPILAQESYDGYIDIPDSIRADFALRVTGDSMVGVGILDGDLAICRSSEAPQTGQIIVALRDEGSISEATLKYFFNGNGEPKLKAANPAYSDIDYTKGYRCAGVMVATLRDDSPSYQVYKEFLTVAGHEEWTGVVNTAASYGLNPREVINILEAQWTMIQRLKG